MAIKELDAIRADAGGAGAEMTSDLGVTAVGEGFLKEEEVVAAGVSFGEGDHCAESKGSGLRKVWEAEAAGFRSRERTTQIVRPAVATGHLQEDAGAGTDGVVPCRESLS